MIEAGQCLLNLDGFKAALCHLQGLTMLELKQRWMRMRQSRDLVRVRKDPVWHVIHATTVATTQDLVSSCCDQQALVQHASNVRLSTQTLALGI